MLHHCYRPKKLAILPQNDPSLVETFYINPILQPPDDLAPSQEGYKVVPHPNIYEKRYNPRECTQAGGNMTNKQLVAMFTYFPPNPSDINRIKSVKLASDINSWQEDALIEFYPRNNGQGQFFQCDIYLHFFCSIWTTWSEYKYKISYLDGRPDAWVPDPKSKELFGPYQNSRCYPYYNYLLSNINSRQPHLCNPQKAFKHCFLINNLANC